MTAEFDERVAATIRTAVDAWRIQNDPADPHGVGMPEYVRQALADAGLLADPATTETRALSHALLLTAYRGYADQMRAMARRIKELEAELAEFQAEAEARAEAFDDEPHGDCTDPPALCCSDAGCPEHGDRDEDDEDVFDDEPVEWPADVIQARSKCNACGQTCQGGAKPAERGGWLCGDEMECFTAYSRNKRPLRPVDEGTQDDG